MSALLVILGGLDVILCAVYLLGAKVHLIGRQWRCLAVA